MHVSKIRAFTTVVSHYVFFTRISFLNRLFWFHSPSSVCFDWPLIWFIVKTVLQTYCVSFFFSQTIDTKRVAASHIFFRRTYQYEEFSWLLFPPVSLRSLFKWHFSRTDDDTPASNGFSNRIVFPRPSPFPIWLSLKKTTRKHRPRARYRVFGIIAFMFLKASSPTQWWTY